MKGNEIAYGLSHHPVVKPFFRGVFARDELASITLTAPSLYVVNTDLARNAGIHWTTIFLPENANALYFDSFGFAPLFFDYYCFLERHSPYFYFNKAQIQSVESVLCGEFCMYLAYMLCSGKTLEQYRSKFSLTAPTLNDAIIKTLFRKVFGYSVCELTSDECCLSSHSLCNGA